MIKLNVKKTIWVFTLVSVTVLIVFAVNFVSSLFSCGYTVNQKEFISSLLYGTITAEEIDEIQVRWTEGSHDQTIIIADESISVFLTLLGRREATISVDESLAMPKLKIAHIDGTECSFEFYGSDKRAYLGAECLRYEKGDWAVPSGRLYDWIALLRKN